LLYLLGRAYERLGKEEVARLQKTAPHSPRAEQLLAESYGASSEWPSAVIHFQNALSLRLTFGGCTSSSAKCSCVQENLRGAAREFEEELRVAPHSLRAVVRRGEARLIQGDLEGALQDWSTALAADGLQAARVLVSARLD